MILPKIFAIYRSDSETFQILQPHVEDGKIVRLKTWARPDRRDWLEATPDERHDLRQWFNGQEWYVQPTQSQGTAERPQIHSVTIHDKEYYFWSLRHSLVWSSAYAHSRGNDECRDLWAAAPQIPVLEFNTKLIYPRSIIGFYTRWVDSRPYMLDLESKMARQEYHNNHEPLPDDHIDPSDLRIRTPRPRTMREECEEYDEDLDDDSESQTLTPDTHQRGRHAPRAKSWSCVSDEIESHLAGMTKHSATMHPCATVTLCVMTTLMTIGTLLVCI